MAIHASMKAVSIRWTGPLDWTAGPSKLRHAHAQKNERVLLFCSPPCRSFVALTVSVHTKMSGETGGSGTPGSPIVLDSDSETESDAETLVQLPGSLLKVICSERYR